MLNEERIMKMSRMAMFEKGRKKACLKISSYYKKDYITIQTIMTLLWCTLGYLIILGGVLALQLEDYLYELTAEFLQEIAVLVVGSYCVTLVIFGGIAVLYYGVKYQRALKVAREYYKALGELSAEYKREK